MDEGVLRFVTEMQDNASAVSERIDANLRAMGKGLPDVMAAIDIDTSGAVQGAETAARVADGIPDGFDAAGTRSGQEYGDSLNAKLKALDPGSAVQGATDALPAVAGRAGDDSGQSFADRFQDKARESADRAASALEANKGALLAVGAGLGVAAGAALGSALGGALERENATAKLTGQLNLTVEESGRYGQLAGQLYAGNYGQSLEEVNGAIASVVSSIDGIRTGSEADMAAAAKSALNLASTFDIDVAGAAQSAGILIKTGLAGSSQEAFDLITAAAQGVGPAMVEPLLEASNEYATYFQALGFSGDQTFSALVSAASGGEIALDKAGDAIKEFGIRATDGSKSTTGTFDDMGIAIGSTVDALLAGGPAAQGAMQEIVTALLSIEDPGTQAVNALALFGTPLEDIGVDKIPEFLTSLQSAGGGLEDFSGRAAELDATLGGTTGATLESLKRQFQGTFATELGQVALPILSAVLGWATQFVGPITAVAAVLGVVAAVIGAVALATAAWSTVQTIVTVATSAWTAAQWLLNAALAAPLTPILLVIAAIALLVGAAVWFFTQTEMGQGIVEAVWGGIQAAIDATVSWVVDTAVPAIVGAWQWVVDKATAMKDGVMGIFQSVAGFFQEWWPLLLAIFMPALFLLLAAWNKWGDDILAFGRAVWAKVKTSVVEPVQEMVQTIMEKIGSVAAWLAFKWAEIKLAATTAWILFKAAVIQPVTEMVDQVSAKASAVTGKVTQPIQDAVDKAKMIASAFLNVGRDIIDGIIDGVTEKAKALADTVATAARNALNAAKSALGIKSPSRAFREQVGEESIAGWAQGMDGSDVVAAAERIARDSVDAAAGVQARAAVMASYAAASAASAPRATLVPAGPSVAPGATGGGGGVALTVVMTNPITGEELRQFVDVAADERIVYADAGAERSDRKNGRGRQ